MYFFKCKNRKANALLLSLAALAMLSTVGITFSYSMRMENRASKFYSDSVNANIIASIGMDQAVKQLRDAFSYFPEGQNPANVPKSWTYKYPIDVPISEEDPITNQRIPNLLEIGTPDDPNHPEDFRTAWEPSFAVQKPTEEDRGHPLKARKVSGRLINTSIWEPGQPDPEDPNKTLAPTFAIDYHRVYTLKIFDISSQINLNSMMDVYNPDGSTYAIDRMGKILDILSAEVAKTTGYSDHINGPLKGLGKQIIAKRNELGGFVSKNDLLRSYVNDNGQLVHITKYDLDYIWDYLTVHPTVSEMKAIPDYLDYSYYIDGSNSGPRVLYKPEMSLCTNIRPDNYSDYESYKKDFRSPININTASRPVLIALVRGLSNTNAAGNAPGITLSDEQADAFVDNIINERNLQPFENLNVFYKFVYEQVLANNPNADPPIINRGAFLGNPTLAYIVLANFDPNVTLRRMNPDALIYQPINKTDLWHYTTEFCFFPTGTFEITSLGQILDDEGECLAARQQYAIVQIFDVLYYKTQYDFEGGSSSIFYKNDDTQVPDLNRRLALAFDNGQDIIGNPAPVISSGLNAFSIGNNLQKDYDNGLDLMNEASDVVGYLIPLGYNLKTSDSLDNAWRFRADFNGTLQGRFRSGTSAPESTIENIGTKQNSYVLIPKASNMTYTNFGDLASDGVLNVNASTITKTRVLKYPSRNSIFKVTQHTSPNDVFPPQGTLMFWFKIGRNWLDRTDEWRTVFFANTSYEPAESYVCGVQREIQMQVLGMIGNSGQTSEDPNMPLLRKVSFRIKNKYFAPYYNNDEPCPYEYIRYERTYSFDPQEYTTPAPDASPPKTYGMHAQEWYHLGLRWQDGTSFDFGSLSPALVVQGLFYYSNNPKQTLMQLVRCPNHLPSQTSHIVSNTAHNNAEYVALYPDLCSENAFFLGNTGLPVGALPADMTIDDFRVSNNYEAYNTELDTLYTPSRFPSATDIDPSPDSALYAMGVFQGKFKGLSQGYVSYIGFTTRNWTPLFFNSGSHTTAPSSPNIVDGYPTKVWEKVWKMMTENVPMHGYKLTDELEMGIYIYRVKKKYHKVIIIDSKINGYLDFWSHKVKSYTKHTDGNKIPTEETNYAYVKYVRGKSPSTYPNMALSPDQDVNHQTDGKWKLTEILRSWVEWSNANHFFKDKYGNPYTFTIDSLLEESNEAQEDYGEIDGEAWENQFDSDNTKLSQAPQPIVINDNTEILYTVKFPVKTVTNPEGTTSPSTLPILQCPMIDEVILIYRIPQPNYFEIYMDIP